MITTVHEDSELCLRRISKVADVAQGAPLAGYAVTTVVSVVEDFVNDVLSGLIDRSPIRGDVFAEELISEVRDGFTSTWDSRHRWLRRAFDTKLSEHAETNAFDELVQLRNALMHGAGKLTAKQAKSLTARLALEKKLSEHLAVYVGPTEIKLTADTSRLAIGIARAYVLRVDQERPPT